MIFSTKCGLQVIKPFLQNKILLAMYIKKILLNTFHKYIFQLPRLPTSKTAPASVGNKGVHHEIDGTSKVSQTHGKFKLLKLPTSKTAFAPARIRTDAAK